MSFGLSLRTSDKLCWTTLLGIISSGTECRVIFSIGGWSGLINGLQKEMSESSSPVPQNVSLEIRSLQMESS